VAQRMKDPERFLDELTRPLAGAPSGTTGAVTDDDLAGDAQSFMSFAAAFGVPLPKAEPDADAPVALPSS